jgi:TolB-like protein
MQAEPAGQTQAKPAGQTQAEPAGQGQAVPAGEGIEELAVKYTLAILPFTGVGREDGETIAELFSFDPTLNKVFAPMPRTSINRAIGREQKFQMGTGMTDPDTVIAIGKQLGAQYVVAGNITSLGNNKLLVISIIRIDKLQQVAGAIQTYTNIEEIQGRLPAMAETIARAVRIDTSKLPGLAIVPFQLRDSTNESDADVLAQILAINIALSGAYAVYPRTATLEQVQDEYANQLAGNTADKNIVAMGKGENPQFVLSGTARKLGSTRNMFNASIIDLASGIQAKGASVNYESIDDGIRAMRRLASDLTGVDLAVYNVNNAETLMDAIADINEDTAENYTITVNMDFVASAITFATNARKTITIRGDARLRTISNIADSALFTLPDGITLVLGNNIRLNGNGKTGRLVEIAKGGTLRMETGATISNGASSGNGGGVYVSGGTFTMSGGTISGNTASYGGGGGGGVFVNSGTFTMSGGTISGNTSSYGGGVYVNSGTFTMSGGTISGNTVSGGYGGGVSVYSSGVFIKTSGTIDGTNSATNGGSVAYVNDSKKRNTTAGPGVTMDSRVAGSAGGWE